MKFSCLQENLNNALNIVRVALPTKSLKPITENILIKTEMNYVTFTATDLEMIITAKISAKIDEQGEVLVPGRLFVNNIETLAQDRVDIFTKKDTKSLYLECAKSKSRISCFEVAEFPIINEPSGNRIELLASELLKIINYVCFSAATDDARPILTSVNIRSREGNLYFGASDGLRLSSYKFPFVENIPVELCIPSRDFQALRNLLTDPEELIPVEFNSSRIMFKTRNNILICQMLQGTFPNYEPLIPNTFETEAYLTSNDLLRSVRSANLFCNGNDGIVKVFISEQGLTVSSKNDETGENTGEIDAVITGQENRFAIKGKFIVDVLNVLKDSKVTLKLNGPAKPIVITKDDDNLTHLIMPMIIQW
jgi:DNA polymerase-3 subunit beta